MSKAFLTKRSVFGGAVINVFYNPDELELAT